MEKRKSPNAFIVVLPGEIIEIPQNSDKSWLTLFYSLPRELAEKWKPAYDLPRCPYEVLRMDKYDHIVCDDKLTLDGIADYVGLNREYLSRLFSKETGIGLFQYINEVRMKRAGEMIRSNKQAYVKEVAAAVGFDDPYFFSRKFKEFYGKTPSEYTEG